MSLQDKIFGKKEDKYDPYIAKNKSTNLTEEELILQAFRKACWDLYISNLPDPKIFDPEDKKFQNSEIVKENGGSVPRGFFTDTKKWNVYFDAKSVPKNVIANGKLEDFARSIFHHEITHFTQVPADGLTEAVLIDSALKGFKDPTILKDPKMASDYSFIVMNIMGDLIGDTLLAKENYGRNDFGDLTVWRTKESVIAARDTLQTPSLLWQTLIATYEKLWNEDLGLNKYIPKRNPATDKAAEDLVKILGKDYRDKKTLEEKIRKFATVLEPIIKQSAQDAQNQKGNSKYGKGGGSGSGLPIPDDVKTQLDHTTESPLDQKKKGKKGKKGKQAGGQPGNEDDNGGEETQIEDNVLDTIYDKNRNSPGKFAGTMGALKGLEPDDALRLMYRARGREFLIKIAEKEHQKAENMPSYQTTWNIGDPLMGKGGLQMIPSVLASGKPIPGLTTYKRRLEPSYATGRLRAIPDLFLVIDSSGSMNWLPWADQVEARGSFDKAVLAAEGAAIYAVENGGRVAVINFSGTGNVTRQDFTKSLDDIEKAIMVHYNGGTVVPVNDVRSVIKKTKNPLITALMSDCDLSNDDDSINAFATGISDNDSVEIFNIYRGGISFVNGIRNKGATIHHVDNINDLDGLVIGAVKRIYDDVGEKDGNV